MSREHHPYKNLERLAARKVLDQALGELVENEDLKETTARRYIVGHLVKQLRAAEALSPEVIMANGIQYHPENTSAARN